MKTIHVFFLRGGGGVNRKAPGLTLTSEVSRWQFFQAADTEWNVRLAWSNLPPCRLRKNEVNGSCGQK